MPRRTAPTRRWRPLRVMAAMALGLVIGVGAYVGFGILTAPRPEEAEGWARLAELPEPRGETAVAVTADGRLVVVGGLARVGFETSAAVSVFDARTEAWAAGPPLPAARHHAAAAAIGNDVYVSGGAGALGDGTPRTDVWVLRAGGTAWEPVAPLPIGRFGHRMVAADGRLWVVGGLDGQATADVYVEPGAVLVFDPVAGTWSTLAPIPVVRDHLAVVVDRDVIWAIGGRAGGVNHALVHLYDIATDTWREGPPLPEPTSGAAEAVIDSWILLSGGEDPALGIVDRHWRLDAGAGDPTWLPLPPPPLAVHGAPGANLNGRFVITGGSARAGGQSNTAWSELTQVLLELP